MASKILPFPNVITMGRDENGRPKEIHTPDFLGLDVREYTVTSDYRDVSKVRISGSDKLLRDAADRSRAYFKALWSKPAPDADADAAAED